MSTSNMTNKRSIDSLNDTPDNATRKSSSGSRPILKPISRFSGPSNGGNATAPSNTAPPSTLQWLPSEQSSTNTDNDLRPSKRQMTAYIEEEEEEDRYAEETARNTLANSMISDQMTRSSPDRLGGGINGRTRPKRTVRFDESFQSSTERIAGARAKKGCFKAGRGKQGWHTTRTDTDKHDRPTATQASRATQASSEGSKSTKAVSSETTSTWKSILGKFLPGSETTPSTETVGPPVFAPTNGTAISAY